MSNFETEVQRQYNTAFDYQNRSQRDFTENAEADTLVVLLHGYNASRYSMRFVWYAATQAIPGSDFFLPALPLETFSYEDPVTIVNDLIKKIDARQRSRNYKRIIIVGHSVGALLARKLYIYACGEPEDTVAEGAYRQLRAPFESAAINHAGYPWAENVDRLVLLAGMNLGWSISQHLSLWTALKYRVGLAFGKYFVTPFMFFKTIVRFSSHGLSALEHPVRPLILNMQRGAAFITNLRVQWIVMREQARQPPDPKQPRRPGSALTVQLLGTVDDIVSPDDNVDLVTGQDFVYIDIPKTGHVTILQMDDSEIGQKRSQYFKDALTVDGDKLQEQNLRVTSIDTPGRREDVKHVVFIIHGIHDLGFWTTRIARRVKALYDTSSTRIEAVTPSYGYFPMLSFLLLRGRHEKVVWLMDRYAEALASYPKADFHFFGHSNGTYLLARAFRDYPFCRFKHVAFAGSVVRTDYEWIRLMQENRINVVINYVATFDWVVAWFPRIFEWIKRMDLGGAGFDGFKEIETAGRISTLRQVNYVIGAHSAATQEDIWDDIAAFLIEGRQTNPAGRGFYRARRTWREKIGGKLAIPIWALILFGVYGIYCVSTAVIGFFFQKLDSAELQLSIAIAVTLLVTYKILTKV